MFNLLHGDADETRFPPSDYLTIYHLPQTFNFDIPVLPESPPCNLLYLFALLDT